MEKAKALVEAGKEQGHCYEKDGLVHWKRSEVAKEEGRSSSKRIDSKRSIDYAKDWDKLDDSMKIEGWTQFAFLGTRLLAIKDIDESAKPASDEALTHLQCAYDQYNDLILDCRALSRNLSMAWLKDPEKKTGTSQVCLDKTLELASKMEVQILNKLTQTLTSDLSKSSDASIKKLLCSVTAPLEELQNSHSQLEAIAKLAGVKTTEPKKRAKKKKEEHAVAE